MFSGAPRELQKCRETRLAWCYAACKNFIERLTEVIRVLDEISDEANPARAVEAIGLRSQTFHFFIGLLVVLGENIFT